MEQFLKENEIIDIVKEYVENKNTGYAIMIDGEWGSGKTYFVREKLEKKLKKLWEETKREIKFIYVSSYGVKSTNELDSKIYEKIILEFLPEKFKSKYQDIERGLGSLYEIIKEFKKLPNIPKNSIRNLIEILQKRNSKNYILIFDDIERCEMPITELLGYINEFVEHKSMKTIIIANEKEILKKKMYSNNELKYLVAENKMLDIPIEKNRIDDIFYKNNKLGKDEDKKINIEELDKRVEKIFGEDLLYSQIKEKLIGITIFYVPDLKSVLETIIDEEISNQKVKECIKTYDNKLINIMQNKNHINIRTLKIALKIIEKIFNVMFEMDLSMYEERIVHNCRTDILTYTMFECIEYKEGNSKESNKTEIFTISEENNYMDVKNGFSFIDDIIKKSYINCKKVKEVKTLYMKTKTEDVNDFEDPINVLGYYWQMDDKDIERNYLLLKEKLRKNLYQISSYPKIIFIIMKLNDIGFPEHYIEDIKKIMYDNLKNVDNIETFNALEELNFSFNNQDEIKKYEEIINPIKDYIEELTKNERKENINLKIEKKAGWGQNFSNYCMEKKNTFISRKEFFNLIDVENLLDCIKISKTKDISDFRRCIATIYNFKNIKEFYEKDLTKLELFLERLQNIDKNQMEKYDKSKKYNIEWLKRNVQDIINILKK